MCLAEMLIRGQNADNINDLFLKYFPINQKVYSAIEEAH